MFLVVLEYIRPIEEVEKYLAEHVAYLDKKYEEKKIIFSGRRNPRIGGVILINEKDKTIADQIVHEDPFYKNEVAKFDIIEFTPSKYDPRFASLVE